MKHKDSRTTHTTSKHTAPEPAPGQPAPGATDSPPPIRRLYRLPRDGKVAGVCAGLADYLEMDVTLVRVLFVILTLASGGFGVLVYLIMAIVMPTSDAPASGVRTGSDVGKNLNAIAADIRDSGGIDRLRNFLGIALILFGAWLLLAQFFPLLLSFEWHLIWPVALIIIGLLVVAQSGRRQ
ncbi:PspC domain-containing protein [Candidatus Saccharibacteria bacterium]|nr:PspC domain-containing protein [Candidatus Saccharibacteria bacterium]